MIQSTTKEIDVWRDTPIRLFGYANEIGESFRYIFPAAYKPSYMLASGYCFCDVVDKAYKAHRANVGQKEVLK